MCFKQTRVKLQINGQWIKEITNNTYTVAENIIDAAIYPMHCAMILLQPWLTQKGYNIQAYEQI